MLTISFARQVLLASCWASIYAEYNFEFGKVGSLLVNPPTHAPSALDGSYQVSLGKPATQSSTNSGGLADFAVDGETWGKFGGGSVTCSQQETDPWWKVSLLGVFEVKQVTVWNRVDCCGDRLNNFTVSVDGQLCGSVAKADIQNIVPCNGKVGTSVTVQLPGTKRILSLAEVEVYGMRLNIPKPSDSCLASLPRLNLTGLEVSQSNGGATAKAAIDGNTDGAFGKGSCTTTNGNDPIQWWRVVLGKVYEISKVVVWNRQDCCTDRNDNIEIRVDDERCGTVLKAERNNTVECNCVRGSSIKVVHLPIPKYAQTILTLCEVQVYGRIFDAAAFNEAEKAKVRSVASRRTWLWTRRGVCRTLLPIRPASIHSTQPKAAVSSSSMQILTQR